MNIKTIIIVLIIILQLNSLLYITTDVSLLNNTNNNKINQQNRFKITDSLTNQILYISNEKSPVKNILTITQTSVSGNNTFLVVGLQKKVIELNSSGNILWENNLGLNQSNYDFLINLKIGPVNGNKEIFGLLSNGTVFQIATNGTIIWSISIAESAYNLDFITATGNNLYELLIAAESKLYYITSSGHILDNFSFNVPLSIIETQDSNIYVGTINGSLYALNNEDLLWKQNLSILQHPITGINYVKGVLFTSVWMENLILLNKSSGQIITTKNLTYIGLLGLNSIFIPDHNNWTVYLSFAGGKIYTFDKEDNVNFFGKYSFNFATIIENNFPTNGTNSTLVVAGDTGSFYILDPLTGSIFGTTNVSISRITSMAIFDINKDNISDMIVGTYLGEIKIIFGKNYILPKFVSDLKYIVTTNKIECYALSNKLVQSLLIVTSNDSASNFSLSNINWITNITFVITGLRSSSIYYLKLIIADENQNTASIGPITVKTQNNPPDIIPMIILIISAIVITIIVVYIIVRVIGQRQAYRKAEMYLKNGNYPEAIKYFYKAKAREKIIEIVKIILSNPELSMKMSEIAQMTELEEYLLEIQDIITHEI